MMDKEKKEEWANNLRIIHDKIKESPYWLNFDDNFLEELCHDFSQLSSNVWNLEKGCRCDDPYYVVLKICGHDFNGMLSDIPYWKKYEIWEKEKENIILVLQAYLSNVHRMIDEIKPEDKVTGYTISMVYKNGKAIKTNLKTYVAEWIEEEKSFNSRYHGLNLIKPESIKALRPILEKNAKDKHYPNTQKWAIECLKDIDEGKIIIGKTWKIKQ